METNKTVGDIRENSDLKNINGITLIALVITIIVLLILAGVTIQTLTGDNGLLQKATNAKEENEEAKELELIKLAVSAAQVAGEGTITTENLNSELQANFNDNKVVSNNDSGWRYKGYKIDNEGNVEKWLPEEYQQVEYIESTGTQCINTGLFENDYPKIYMEMNGSFTSSTNGQYIFNTGYFKSNNESAFVLIGYTSSRNINAKWSSDHRKGSRQF